MESITLITNWPFDAIQSIQLLNQFNYSINSIIFWKKTVDIKRFFLYWLLWYGIRLPMWSAFSHAFVFIFILNIWGAISMLSWERITPGASLHFNFIIIFMTNTTILGLGDMANSSITCPSNLDHKMHSHNELHPGKSVIKPYELKGHFIAFSTSYAIPYSNHRKRVFSCLIMCCTLGEVKKGIKLTFNSAKHSVTVWAKSSVWSLQAQYASWTSPHQCSLDKWTFLFRVLFFKNRKPLKTTLTVLHMWSHICTTKIAEKSSFYYRYVGNS